MSSHEAVVPSFALQHHKQRRHHPRYSHSDVRSLTKPLSGHHQSATKKPCPVTEPLQIITFLLHLLAFCNRGFRGVSRTTVHDKKGVHFRDSFSSYLSYNQVESFLFTYNSFFPLDIFLASFKPFIARASFVSYYPTLGLLERKKKVQVLSATIPRRLLQTYPPER